MVLFETTENSGSWGSSRSKTNNRKQRFLGFFEKQDEQHLFLFWNTPSSFTRRIPRKERTPKEEPLFYVVSSRNKPFFFLNRRTPQEEEERFFRNEPFFSWNEPFLWCCSKQTRKQKNEYLFIVISLLYRCYIVSSCSWTNHICVSFLLEQREPFLEQEKKNHSCGVVPSKQETKSGYWFSGNSLMVEYSLAKAEVEGSSPFFRFFGIFSFI